MKCTKYDSCKNREALCHECNAMSSVMDHYPCYKKDDKTTEDVCAPVDIHKVIDDAMEKRDRSVTIFISKEATTVSVYPYPDEEPRWIPVTLAYSSYPVAYKCSNCGRETNARTLPPYCDMCGEKLKQPE